MLMTFKSSWCCIFLLAALSTSVAAGDIYKFRHDNGDLLFTNQVGEDGLPKVSDSKKYKLVSKAVFEDTKTLKPVDVQDKNKKKETEPAVAIVNPQNDTPSEEVSKYIKAAEQGDADAQFNLGVMYDKGQGVAQDYSQAADWYRKAAEQGNANAQYNLGVMYLNGQGAPQDDSQAANWFRKAAEQGSANSQYNLGYMYRNGQGVPQDDSQAVNWYRKAAEQGNAMAQHNLGSMYRNGQGVPQDDSQAANWYRKAAEQGSANSQYRLGYMYRNGQGVPQDDSQAANWYRKAAEQGSANAQFELGVMYSVQQDYSQAANWFRKAAEQGHSEALFKLAKIYELGSDIEQNFVLAQTFYNLSEVAGNKNASTSKEMLRKKLTKDQLLEAKKLSEEWTIGSSLPQITNADKKAEIAKAKAIAKQEMEERVRRQRDYPYTAEITCTSGNGLFGLMLCFEKSELKITINNRSKAYTYRDFIMGTVDNGEVSDNYTVAKVYLPKHFRVTAQNSYSPANFILGVKITNSTGHVVFEDQAGSFGVVNYEH
jgi:TPR repeat protein